ncbi:MAG: tetrapyrrole methylase [Deltaproteobacteria bacterium]|nr:tetrapyrrole methylase [Deltaproteobacteria bacterium]
MEKTTPGNHAPEGGVPARERGRFFVISTGPAGPPTATLQAIETLKRVEAVAAPAEQVRLFAEYIGDKPVLFDPWKGVFDFRGKQMRDLDEEEKRLFQHERFLLREERVGRVRGLLSEGKDVGLLETGNPCLFGPGHWYTELFDARDVVLIPGMGCDAAAMAALGKSTIPAYDVRFLLQTYPFSLLGEDLRDTGLLRELARNPCTIVFYMALWNIPSFFASLREVLPRDMPCAVVFWAGYPDRERVVRGTLGDMEGRLRGEEEDFMGLVLVGRFLDGRPYEESMRRLTGPGKPASSRGRQ